MRAETHPVLPLFCNQALNLPSHESRFLSSSSFSSEFQSKHTSISNRNTHTQRVSIRRERKNTEGDGVSRYLLSSPFSPTGLFIELFPPPLFLNQGHTNFPSFFPLSTINPSFLSVSKAFFPVCPLFCRIFWAIFAGCCPATVLIRERAILAKGRFCCGYVSKYIKKANLFIARSFFGAVFFLSH